MTVPFRSLEQSIDDAILTKAMAIVRRGDVKEVEHAGSEIMAHVRGTHTYTVRFTLREGQVSDHRCTCPYDYGPVCKHLAAVILEMQRDELGIERSKAKKQKKSGSARRADKPSIRTVLDNMTRDDLEQLIERIAAENPAVERQVFMGASSDTGGAPKSYYTKQLRSAMGSSRNPYLHPERGRALNAVIMDFDKAITHHIEKGGHPSALTIAMALIEALGPKVDTMLDRTGLIATGLWIGVKSLKALLDDESTTNAVRKKVHTNCMRLVRKNFLKGWDWWIELVGLAERSARTGAELESVEDIVAGSTSMRGVERSNARLIYIRLLRRTGRTAEADRFIQEHLHDTMIRRLAIDEALQAGDADKAERLAKEGIEDDRDLLGLVMDWTGALLDVARLRGDDDRIIQIARHLFVNGQREHTVDLFDLLKSTVPRAEWQNFVHDLVSDIDARGAHDALERCADILHGEGEHDRLVGLMNDRLKRGSLSIHQVEQLEPVLAGDFATDLVGFYAALIPSRMVEKTGGAHYRYVCRFIRRMKKLGGIDEARQLVEDLRSAHRNRPALLAELDRI